MLVTRDLKDTFVLLAKTKARGKWSRARDTNTPLTAPDGPYLSCSELIHTVFPFCLSMSAMIP